MSQPLQSLVYKTLGVGQGKVFSVELPRSNDASVAQRIKQYCKQLDRPCLVVDGASVDKNNLLSKLQNLFGIQQKSDGFKASNYRIITKLIRSHRTGVLCVNDAHLMSSNGEQLLGQLVHYARKHKLAWKFYFLSKRSDEASQLNSSFGVQKSLMWNEREGDWFFVEKADASPNIRNNKASLLKGVIIALAIFAAIYVFLHNQPEPRKISDIGSLVSANVDVTSTEISEVSEYDPLGMDSLNQRGAEFDKAMAELNTDTAVSGFVDQHEKSLSDAIVQAVNDGDVTRYMQLLSQNREALNGVNEHGESLLVMAVIAKQKPMIDEILRVSSNVNHQDKHGRTALFYASISGQIDVVRALINYQADVNLESKLFKTPLMGAIHNNHQDVAKLLISHDAKIDSQDHSGWTAMFYAVWNSRLDLVDLLLESGANVTLLDQSGNNLKQVASMRGSNEFQTQLNARL